MIFYQNNKEYIQKIQNKDIMKSLYKKIFKIIYNLKLIMHIQNNKKNKIKKNKNNKNKKNKKNKNMNKKEYCYNKIVIKYLKYSLKY